MLADEPLRYVIYVRVSDADKQADNYSLPSQLLACRQFALELGRREDRQIKEIEVITDMETGTNMLRKAKKQAILPKSALAKTCFQCLLR